MQISSKSSVKIAVVPHPAYSTKNAWAALVRRRWPANGVKLAQHEWSLSEGEAKGLFAAQVSQPTIDKIGDHPNGGFKVCLEALELRFHTTLRDYLASEEAELKIVAIEAAASAHIISTLLASTPGDLITVLSVRQHERRA